MERSRDRVAARSSRMEERDRLRSVPADDWSSSLAIVNEDACLRVQRSFVAYERAEPSDDGVLREQTDPDARWTGPG